MCGIVFTNLEVTKKDFKNKWIYPLNHRGPDSSSCIFEKEGFFGHTRLSIVELSSNSDQPYTDASGDILIYNGEIYNYKDLNFRYDLGLKGIYGDSQVLFNFLKKYGSSKLDQINGMFAFVFFSKSENSIICARDRFGVKPLFYSLKKSKLSVCS